MEQKNSSKQNKIGQLTILYIYIYTHTYTIYTFERVENFKYLDVTLNEGNNHQIHLQDGVKNANKTYMMLQKFLEIKIYLKN